MESPYLVTGRIDTLPNVYPRLEIRALEKDSYQWSLYIFASSVLQGRELPVPGLSYPKIPEAARFLHIGGIHGLPFERWPGDPQGKVDPRGGKSKGGDDAEPGSTDYQGYCTHASVMFPTWHRPFMMLIEQALGEVATNLANQIVTKFEGSVSKTAWLNAARELRQPYWDWLDPSTGTEGLPKLFTDEKVLVVMPTGFVEMPRDVANPLQTFHFGKTRPKGFEPPFLDYERTYRYPVKVGGNLTDDVAALNKAIKDGYKDLVEKWALTFLTPPDLLRNEWSKAWDEFSNTSPQSGPPPFDRGPKRYGSLEAPHNSVHNLVGGDGQMADPSYSGFDPVFYAHHTNVDRLLEEWHTVYPNYFMGSGWVTTEGKIKSFEQPGSTYAQLDDSDGGYKINEDSGLWPFRKANGQYWTSSNVIYPTSSNPLGYKYVFSRDTIRTDSDTSKTVAATEPGQEVLAADKETDHEMDKRRAQLQRRYGFDPHAAAEKLKKSKSPLFIGGTKRNHSVPEGHSSIDNYRYFIIDVELLEFGFNGSHNLIVYTHSGERIGMVSVFSRFSLADCPSCQGRRANGNIIRGVIPVPPTIVAEILEKGGWDAEEEKAAIQNFKNSLRAEIRTAGGKLLAHINAANPPATLVPLDETNIPKISLRSAFAAHPTDWKDGPIRLHGWEEYDKVFDETKWHKEA